MLARIAGPALAGAGIVLTTLLGWQVSVRRGLENEVARLQEDVRGLENEAARLRENVRGLEDDVAQLRENVRRRERGLANSPVPIVVVASDGAVRSENAAAVMLLGRTASTAEGTEHFLTVTGTDGRTAPLVVTESMPGTPLFLHTADGDRPVTVYSTPAPGGDGWLLVISDETRQWELQQELAQSQKREALGHLAAQVAHDFNNLLTPIAGYVDLVLTGDSPLSDDDRQMLGECARATARAAALVDKILAASRQQRTEQAEVVEAAGLLRGLSGLLAGVAGAPITLRVRVPPAELTVDGLDQTAFEQIVVNLVANARDATPPGGRITVDLREDGPDAILTVTDTGSGMEPATAAKIFDPFYTTKRGRGGTGLGLATVRGIVENAGGRIDVASEPGHGTTFTLRLRRTERQAESGPVGEQVRPQIAYGDERLILIVEDDPQVRSLIQALLRRHGYRTLVYACAEDARDDGERHLDHVRLLLTDVVLPGIHGPELARWIAARRPGLPVVYLTGYAEGELTGQSGIPADAILLRKPFQADELLRTLGNALREG